jgi:uncharacterized protein YqgC (DUF456 family)
VNGPRYGQPAFIGGLVMGVLSALPIVNLGNCACCMWVVLGGVVAAYVLQQNQAAPITVGDGALVGLLAGLIGAVVDSVINIPIAYFVAPFQRQLLERIIDMSGNMPPEFRDAMNRYGGGDAPMALIVAGKIFGLMFLMCVGAVFSTVGGLLGAAIFKKQTPPGTIDVTPVPPPVS